jgi:hypothetical protein
MLQAAILDCGPFDPFSLQLDFCAAIRRGPPRCRKGHCPTTIEDDELHEPVEPRGLQHGHRTEARKTGSPG